MKVYRITKTKYAEDLSGTGAKLYGGRWNHIDSACIYTADSRALSVLEYAININIDFIPRALSLCVFEIDESHVYSFKQEDLSGNWRATPAPKSTKDYGTQFLKSNKPILKIPSIIIPEEFNYIINPQVAGLSFKLVEIKDFVFDLRIKKK